MYSGSLIMRRHSNLSTIFDKIFGTWLGETKLMLRELGEAALQQNLQEFFFLRSGFRSFCTHTSISVRCIMEAWRRRILSEPRLFCFCSGLFSGSECREFSWCSKQMLFLHYFAKLICNWQILKKRLFWKDEISDSCIIIWSMFSKVLLLLFFVPNLWI